jgi:NADH-quinone oxidoreductase subunit M
VVFGKLEKPALAHILDLSPREIITFAPLLILTILFGIYPKPVLDMSAASVTALLDNYQHSLARNATPAAAPRLATGDQSHIKINYVIAGERTAAPLAASGK